MFNLFPKKKSVDEIITDTNLTPHWEWTPTQTPSMLQAQNELIEQFLKENHDLKIENANLKEILSKYKDGYQGSCYACEPVGELNQKNEKEIDFLKKKIQIIRNDYTKCAQERDEYKHQLNAANREIDELKKKNNYPIHWGGYTDETPWETASADLALRVVKLERKVEELTLIKMQLCQKQS